MVSEGHGDVRGLAKMTVLSHRNPSAGNTPLALSEICEIHAGLEISILRIFVFTNFSYLGKSVKFARIKFCRQLTEKL